MKWHTYSYIDRNSKTGVCLSLIHISLVLWNNQSWITDKGKYDSKSKKFTANKGAKTDDAYVENIKKIVANKISFSDQVLENDYYRVLFGK